MKNPDCIIYGLGYIGLPTAVFLASKKIRVHGIDINTNLLNDIKKGKVETKEDGLNKMLKHSVSNKLFSVGTKYIKSKIHIIVVPTPFKSKNEPDISIVEKISKNLVKVLSDGDLIILESTSPVGTTERIRDIIYDQKPILKDKIYFSYCPERVLPGQIFSELRNNDRVVGGIDYESSLRAKNFYEKFVDGKIHITDSRTAEMCKLVENSSRDVQIAFANELSIICDKANINVWKLIDLANKHPRVDILKPSCGVGGHCIAVDPYFIYSQYPLESKIISQAREINNYKSFWCYEKIKEKFDSLNHKEKNIRIGLLGLSFKPDIDDIRESPALEIAKKVHNRYGPKRVLICEPNLTKIDLFNILDFKYVIDNSDILVFLVNHSIFKNLKINKKKHILDFCGTFKQ